MSDPAIRNVCAIELANVTGGTTPVGMRVWTDAPEPVAATVTGAPRIADAMTGCTTSVFVLSPHTCAFESASGAEAVRRSEKLKTALLDAVTHDMRTPLTSIKASVTMLIEENFRGPDRPSLDDTGRGELLEVINEEADRLNTFVESMVELAQIQSGQRQFQRTGVLPEEIIVAAARRAKAIKSTHKLSSSIQPGLPKLSVDPRALAEAIFNLLQNAANHSPAGSTIRISAEKANGSVRFAVEDEGTGIPKEEREAVFERFYRSSASAGGLGMGLAIVRGIIEGHGGKIWVETGTKGARLVFDLPVPKDE